MGKEKCFRNKLDKTSGVCDVGKGKIKWTMKRGGNTVGGYWIKKRILPDFCIL